MECKPAMPGFGHGVLTYTTNTGNEYKAISMPTILVDFGLFWRLREEVDFAALKY
ncbi:MAG: hypothetical protein HOO93_08340 [Methyloglobulus sp.]|nr:hypothetical protein [Methyloglobulus sp.]